MTDEASSPGRPSLRRMLRRGEPVTGVDATVGPAAAPDAPPPGRTVWAFLNRPFAIGFFLVLGGLVAVLLGMAVSQLVTVWIYIAFALFVALGLDPVVRRLQQGKLSRAGAIAIVYVLFAIFLAAVLWLIIPTVATQVAAFISDLPTTIESFEQTAFYTWVTAQLGDSVSSLLSELESLLTDPNNLAAIGGGVLQVGVSVVSTLSGMLIVIVLSLYFVATLPQIKQAFYRLAPARTRPLLGELTEEITASVGSYLAGMVILAFFNALFTFLLYLALGLPFPQLLAVIAFCITIIPLVGPVLFWVIGSLVALISDPLLALIFAGVYLLYMQIEAYVITPRVMNKAISVPGSLVVIGALVGGTLMGLLGALVAIPVTASILLILKKVIIPKQDAKV